MRKSVAGIGTVLAGVGIFLLGESVTYGQRRPLPPPVIVVHPVPKVEIYRLTPYWMAVPSYEFRYTVRYPPRPRSYRGVYVAWPWPVYVPYAGPSAGIAPPSPPLGPGPKGSLWTPEEAPGEPVLPEQTPGGPFGPGEADRLRPPTSQGPVIVAPEVPPEAPPEPSPEEPLPELIPPPMPQPLEPGPEQKK